MRGEFMARSGDAHEEIWGTWEDLLLASAVHRHGTSRWDAVAAEVQSRTAASHLLTENSCRNRYEEIQRRLSENGAAVVGSSDEGAGDLDQSESGAWIEELRKLRVEELRREVQRYDLSIVSLELKVNRLKEEHELSVKESDPSGGDAKQEPTVEDGKHDDEDRSPGSAAAEISSRSCKESNSTDLKHDEEDKQHKSSKSKQDDESGTCAEEDAGTDRTGGETTKRESGESSDVQSSASLSTRHRKAAAAASSSSEVETEARSEPLVALMEFIRSHPSASLFQRRQPSQESEDYKLMIKRHVDLDTIQSKLDLLNSLESYSSPLEFYRDLLLLFTNSLLFFPKSSPQYSAAFSLLSLTNSHLSSSNLIKPHGISSSSSSSRKEVKIIDILNEKIDMDKKVNPILEKPTIIMCRKRSSLSKPNNSLQNDTSSIKEERQQIINSGLVSDSDPNLKKISTTRGPRTNKTRTKMTLHSLNPNPNSSISKPQKQHSNSADKKRTAVDFLNRLNQSAPATSSSRVSMVEKGGKSQSEGKKGNKKSLSSIGKRNVGRPPKRPESSSVTPPPAKRFKEEKGKKRGGGRR